MIENELIRDFYRDTNGLCWLITSKGLAHFDGYELQYITLPDSANSGINNKIDIIESAHENQLWLGSHEEGLHLYNWKTGKLKSYYHDENDSNSIPDDRLNMIKKDDNGITWFGFHHKGIGKYNSKNDQFSYFTFVDTSLNESEHTRLNIVSSYAKQDSTTYWFTSTYGLIKFDTKQNNYEIIPRPSHLTKYIDGFTSIAKQNDSTYWLGDWGGGLFQFNTFTYEWKHYYFKRSARIDSTKNIIRDLCFQTDSTLWVTTYTKGIATFNINTKQFTFYDQTPKTGKYQLPSATTALFQDLSGNTWVSFLKGLGFIGKEKNPFEHKEIDYFVDNDSRSFMTSDIITFKGHTFLASYNGPGILEIKHGKISTWNKNSLQHLPNRLTNFFVHQEKLYVYGNGNCYKVNLEKKLLEYIPFKLPKNIFYRGFIYDGKKHIYIGSRWKGFFKLNLESLDVKQFKYGKKGKGFYVHDFIFDKNSLLWIAYDRGISVYNSKSDEIQTINHQDSSLKSINLKIISTLQKDATGYVWLGDYSGHFAKVHEDSLFLGKIHDCRSLLGHEDLKIYDFLIHKDGSFSFMNDTRFSFYNNKLTYQGSVAPSDGFPKMNKFWKLKALNDSTFFVSSYHGYFILHKDKLFDSISDAIPIISGISIMNKPYEQAGKVYDIEHIKLPYDQNFISFKLVPLQMNNPSKNRIRWKLEGIDPDWQEKKGNHIASYTALQPGEYNLKLMAANALGRWNPKAKEVTLIITPPYWQTWWFRGLTLLGVIFVLITLYAYRIHQVKKRERLKKTYEQALTEVEIKALRAQMNPHFIFNSLNSVKHFLISGQIKEGVSYVNKFSRLLRLILNQSQLTETTLKAELEFVQLYLSIEQIRFSKSFTWEIDIHPSVQEHQLLIPPMVIQPFVENSIWHGLMHKDGLRKIHIVITPSAQASTYYCITIIDNGIGRKKAGEIKSKSVLKEKSLGMKLTKQRIHLLINDHSITPLDIVDLYDSNGNPEGTKIVLTLPKKNVYYVESDTH